MRHTHRFTFILFVMLIAAAICAGIESRPSAAAYPAPLSAKVGDFDGYYMLIDKASYARKLCMNEEKVAYS